MNKQDRNPLSVKLSANWQRRQREKYLDSLPAQLRELLAACSFIQSPEVGHLVEQWFVFGPNGLGTNSKHQLDDYKYLEFAWEEKLFAQLRRITEQHDSAEAYFWPSLSNPVYRIEFGKIRPILIDLWTYSPGELGLVRQDFMAGILLSNTVGLIPEDPSPCEIVYELGLWGFGKTEV